MHVKYQSPIMNGFKVRGQKKASVTDRQTDGQTDGQTDRQRKSDPYVTHCLKAGDTKSTLCTVINLGDIRVSQSQSEERSCEV